MVISENKGQVGNNKSYSINLMLIASLLAPFTLLFFGPIEIQLSSPADFWFNVRDTFLPCFFVTLIAFLLLFGILYILFHVNRNVSRLAACVFCAIGIAVYLQGNWMFVSYGKMDGSPIDWSAFGLWPIINTVLWIVIVCGISWIVFSHPKLTVFLSGLSCCILMIEILTCGILLVTSTHSNKESGCLLTNCGELTLSEKNKNILVVLADGFDGCDFPVALDEEPDLKECFDGFTFYEDTCGTSLYSEESGITILTGNQFETGLSFPENVSKAYAESLFYDALVENHYDVYLYASDGRMVSKDIAEIVVNSSENDSGFTSNTDLLKAIYKMVLFRYAPHVLKNHFWYTSMDFSALRDNQFNCSNILFYDVIKDQGVVLDDSTQNIYQFFWIQGPHEPVVMDRYIHPIEKVKMGDDEYAEKQKEQSIGVVRLFTELIKELKESGVYDNTVLILLADHGWDIRANPLLLIKPQNAHGPLQVSSVPVSMIEDYAPTFLSFITDKQSEQSIVALEEGMERNRPFYVYDINKDRTYNSRRTDYYPSGYFHRYSFILGQEIMPAQIKQLGEYGFASVNERDGLWTDGHKAKLHFEPCTVRNDLSLAMNYSVFHDSQQILVFANGEKIGDYTASGEEVVAVDIPASCLNGEFLDISFEFPDAISPNQLNQSNDRRELALDFYSIMLSEKTLYPFGTEIVFSTRDNNALKYIRKGFYSPEEGGMWTKGTETELQFHFQDDVNGELVLNMDYTPFDGEQRVLIYANNDLICDYIAREQERKTVKIPASCISGESLRLRFELPDAHSPYSIGASNDARELALKIHSMSIQSVDR